MDIGNIFHFMKIFSFYPKKDVLPYTGFYVLNKVHFLTDEKKNSIKQNLFTNVHNYNTISFLGPYHNFLVPLGLPCLLLPVGGDFSEIRPRIIF